MVGTLYYEWLFLADNLQTIYDLYIEYNYKARLSPILTVYRRPCFVDKEKDCPVSINTHRTVTDICNITFCI